MVTGAGEECEEKGGVGEVNGKQSRMWLGGRMISNLP